MNRTPNNMLLTAGERDQRVVDTVNRVRPGDHIVIEHIDGDLLVVSRSAADPNRVLYPGQESQLAILGFAGPLLIAGMDVNDAGRVTLAVTDPHRVIHPQCRLLVLNDDAYVTQHRDNTGHRPPLLPSDEKHITVADALGVTRAPTSTPVEEH